MLKKINAFIVCILAVVLLIAAICSASEMVSGITKNFDVKTGRLVIQTASQREATFSVPQSVKVYLKTKERMIEIADSWRFLQDNLVKGTKVQLMPAGGSIVTIWIMEVPR
jgi:hypothetical protein